MYAMRLLMVLFIALTFLMFRCHDAPGDDIPDDHQDDQQPPNEEDNWIDVTADNFYQYYEVVVIWPDHHLDATTHSFLYTVQIKTLTGVIVESALRTSIEIFWNYSIRNTQTQVTRSCQYQWNFGISWVFYHQTQSDLMQQGAFCDLEQHEVVLSVNYAIVIHGAMGKVSLDSNYAPPTE
ncbi:MAG: hypothetical protein EA375_00255 [Acholeplasmataceae bacterium]|nr:MAG: hypothetical protein EA375_00255 [Acholeplasmataceae bacterium]